MVKQSKLIVHLQCIACVIHSMGKCNRIKQNSFKCVIAGGTSVVLIPDRLYYIVDNITKAFEIKFNKRRITMCVMRIMWCNIVFLFSKYSITLYCSFKCQYYQCFISDVYSDSWVHYHKNGFSLQYKHIKKSRRYLILLE